MRYWDSSALVPLLVEEPGSATLRLLMREDDHIATWSWSRTEVISAIERRCRESSRSRPQRLKTLTEFAELRALLNEPFDFVSLDDRLSNAAELEGFRVVPEPSARQH